MSFFSNEDTLLNTIVGCNPDDFFSTFNDDEIAAVNNNDNNNAPSPSPSLQTATSNTTASANRKRPHPYSSSTLTDNFNTMITPKHQEKLTSSSFSAHRSSSKLLQQQPDHPEPSDANTLHSQLESQDPNNVITALNTLLKLSSDHDANFALGIHGEKVIQSLVNIFDETIGWTANNHATAMNDTTIANINGNVDTYTSADTHPHLEPSEQTWEFQSSSPSLIGPRMIVPLPLQHEHTTNERKYPISTVSWPLFCATRFTPTSLNTSLSTPSHILPYNILWKDEDVHSEFHIKILEIIIMILRNLSFVAANQRFLLHSEDVLRILTGCLYFRNFVTGKAERGPKSERYEEMNTTISSSSSGGNDLGNSANNMCLHSLQTFMNLASLLDISGRKLFVDLLFLDGGVLDNATTVKTPKSLDSMDVKSIISHSEYGQINNWAMGGFAIAKKFDVKEEIPLSKIPDIHTLLRPIVEQHIQTTLSIFPPFVVLLGITTSRPVVISALELLKELLDNPDVETVFLYTPDTMLYHLVRLLWIPRLGPDSLEYVDPTRNMVSRVTAMKLMGGYDANVDYELRDRSLEVLWKITNLSTEVTCRLGQKISLKLSQSFGVDESERHCHLPNTRLYDSLIPILTTQIGRDQTPLFAAKIVLNLAKAPGNEMGLRYASKRIVSAASFADEQISNILCNAVLKYV